MLHTEYTTESYLNAGGIELDEYGMVDIGAARLVLRLTDMKLRNAREQLSYTVKERTQFRKR